MSNFLVRTLVPEPFREFLPMVSPSGLRVIHKEQVLVQALAAAKDYLTQAGHTEETENVKKLLLSTPLSELILVTEKLGGNQKPLSSQTLSPAEMIQAGEAILRLYFFLIQSESTLFLDLRPHHFHWDSPGKQLVWLPSRLRHRRTPYFSESLRALYRGFFDRDPESTQRGIELYRWESKPKAGFDQRIEALLRQHFGDAESAPVLFSMEHFKKTFHLIFEEAIQSESRFHPELVFIGTALAGMYQTLEALNHPLDVKSAYRSVFV